ncbi:MULTISPECIES: dTMP kinase [Paenibacillus]|uniref:dTMP kinase n=1 Tax=Paenibacillus TaxID=44249 RepID=UPI002041DDAA|nr:dTMP kinase [Paenibacillus camelliae]MCM3635910.1 dTMP kinase [Paenibacillus camelliae]
MKKGYFITLEGNEGAGKSSIVEMAAQYLSSKGLEVITSREPGGIAIAEQIRSVILDKNNTMMDGRTEALLYAAARRQHYIEKISPSLQDGKTIICDRFIDSSLAYQGHARGLGIDEILSINEFAVDGMFPDLTLYLDVDPEIGLQRIRENENREVNRLDLESLSFHHKVREGYLEVVNRFPERIVKINANEQLNAVFEEVKRVFDQYLGNNV